jgi:hypothetical protein
MYENSMQTVQIPQRTGPIMSYLLLQRFQLQLLSLPKTAARIILSQKNPAKTKQQQPKLLQ